MLGKIQRKYRVHNTVKERFSHAKRRMAYFPVLVIALLVAFLSTTMVHTKAAGGPIGAWKLDEGSGTTVADSSGNGNNGTIIRGTGTGSPAWVSPGHDASMPFALDFDGSGAAASASNSVNLGNAATLDQMDNYTVSLWVKFKPGYVGGGGAWANLVGRNSSPGNWAWMIYVNNAGHIRPHHRNANGTYAPLTDSAKAMPVNEWVHIEQVADGGKLHLYINGEEDPNFPINYSGTTMSLPTANTYIGQDARERAPLATISDVKIYNDAVVAPQVSTNAATDLTRTSAMLNGTLDSLGDFTDVNVYFRYRLAASNDPYTDTTPQVVSAVGPFSANVSGLTPGTQYEYMAVVQWTGRDGTQDAAGTTTTFTTPLGPTAPAPVIDLQAAPDGTDKIDLSWNTPDDGGSPILGYKIERSLDGITWEVVVADTGTTDTAYQDTGRTANTAYHYRVSAINAIGTAAPSDTASATTDQLVPEGTTSNPGAGPSASSSAHGLANTGQNIALMVGAAVLLIGGSLLLAHRKMPTLLRK